MFSVKSRGQAIPSGYSPEAYPMGAVAPVAPIASLPTDNYPDMKVSVCACDCMCSYTVLPQEVTLRMQEIDDSSSDLHIMDV